MAALKTNTKLYVLDTNVLIHDPAAILNFEEHQVVIPMTVLEELDKLKMGKAAIATDCREAIRKIDKIIGDASPTEVAKGVPIIRPDGSIRGHLSISFQKIMIFHRFLKLSQGMILKRYHYLLRKNSVITQGKLTSFFHTRMHKLKIGLMIFLKDVSMILGLTRMRSPKMSTFSYIQC